MYGNPAHPVTPNILRGMKWPQTALNNDFCKAISNAHVTVGQGYNDFFTVEAAVP